MTRSDIRRPTRIDRPSIPAEYEAGRGDEYVSWDHVEDRLTRDRVVWVATVSNHGRPRVRPVDCLYVDGHLWVGGSPETAWVRDIGDGAPVTVHLDSVTDVVILEGEAQALSDIDANQSGRLAAASNAKFPEYQMTPDTYRRGAIRIRISKVVAWTDFAKDPTRFRYEPEE